MTNAVASRDWASTLVRARVERAIDFYRSKEPHVLIRGSRRRLDVIELFAKLRYFLEAQKQVSDGLLPTASDIQADIPWHLSELSPEKPIDKVESARKQFEALAERAENGDLYAAKELRAVAIVFVKLARQCFVGMGYTNTFNGITERMQRVQEALPANLYATTVAQLRVVLSFLQRVRNLPPTPVAPSDQKASLPDR
jgi:hypothetical protein